MIRIRRVTERHAEMSEVAAADAAVQQHEVIRDFDDPYLELVRLLREASEIEHALMVQYLYAANSLKPAYEMVRGLEFASSGDLLGVAVGEMLHLATVNKMLVAVGAAPNLVRQDFPYETDIYPFELNLEPLTRTTLARYVYTEAPADALDPAHPDNADPGSRRSSRCSRTSSAGSSRTVSAACTTRSSRSLGRSAG